MLSPNNPTTNIQPPRREGVLGADCPESIEMRGRWVDEIRVISMLVRYFNGRSHAQQRYKYNFTMEMCRYIWWGWELAQRWGIEVVGLVVSSRKAGSTNILIPLTCWTRIVCVGVILSMGGLEFAKGGGGLVELIEILDEFWTNVFDKSANLSTVSCWFDGEDAYLFRNHNHTHEPAFYWYEIAIKKNSTKASNQPTSLNSSSPAPHHPPTLHLHPSTY